MYEHIKKELESFDKGELSEHIIGLTIGGYDIVEQYAKLVSLMEKLIEEDLFEDDGRKETLLKHRKEADSVVKRFMDFSENVLKRAELDNTYEEAKTD